MLYQLHWQYKNGKTEMKAQKDINSHDEMRVFISETQKKYPIPEKVIWMACNEQSEKFVLMEK